MAGRGDGRSRRSHTKSRKGCKTCKRRHIRCDETFPQCRNCTKHQVRCDNINSPSALETYSPQAAQQPNLLWTSEIEAIIGLWKQTGEFPFPELPIHPQPQWRAYAKTDLRLIHHLLFITNEMFRDRASKMTLWVDVMPKMVSLAASHPFVMHSILAFSASHLAWISQSTGTQNLAFHHASIALKGLHEGVTSLTMLNSDAVLASSLLLAWQATDWKSWASLVTSTKTVIQVMQSWRHESVFTEYIARHSPIPNQHFMDAVSLPICQKAHTQRLNTLTDIYNSLQCMQPYLDRDSQETKWVDQLKSYLDRLQVSSQAQTPEEQFNQLYTLRKWLFWVPTSLLSAKSGDINVLCVLAYLYATALALEPIFPDAAPAFVSDLSLFPLEQIVTVVQAYQDLKHDSRIQTVSYLVQYPADMVSSCNIRREWKQQQASFISRVQQSPHALETTRLGFGKQVAQYSYRQSHSLSPALAPVPLKCLPAETTCKPYLPFLDVLRTSMDAYGSSTYITSSNLFSIYASSNYTSPLRSPAEEQLLLYAAPPWSSLAEDICYPTP